MKLEINYGQIKRHFDVDLDDPENNKSVATLLAALSSLMFFVSASKVFLDAERLTPQQKLERLKVLTDSIEEDTTYMLSVCEKICGPNFILAVQEMVGAEADFFKFKTGDKYNDDAT